MTKTINGTTLTYEVETDEATGKTCVVITRAKGAKGEFEIPSEIKGIPVASIGDEAFAYCNRLSGITIPDGVASIRNRAFYNCSGLKNVTMPDGVTSVGREAFAGCTGLTGITIGEGVTSIGYYAFANCSGLTSVTIPAGVKDIGSATTSGLGSPFYFCSGLMSFEVSPDNECYKSVDGLVLTKDGGELVCAPGGLTSVTVPDGVTRIGDAAFQGCECLEDVIIPEGVTSVGRDAFDGCSGLTRVAIPDSVTEIGWQAFYDCSGLTSVTIPDGVAGIGGAAFMGCSGLKSVSLPKHLEGKLPDDVFEDCPVELSITYRDAAAPAKKCAAKKDAAKKPAKKPAAKKEPAKKPKKEFEIMLNEVCGKFTERKFKPYAYIAASNAEEAKKFALADLESQEWVEVNVDWPSEECETDTEDVYDYSMWFEVKSKHGKFCGTTSALGYSDSEARDKVIQDFGKGGISFSPINLFLSVSEN